jgi:branched-subunit amino acid aminotransferase/4-amino-4-deoxychorismate lyase
MPRIVYFNGDFVAEAYAQIPIDDGGWLHGAGLFETMRAENGRIFRLESHMERLARSMTELIRPIEQDQLPSGAAFEQLLERNELANARVRLTITAGSTRGGPSKDMPPLTVCVTALPLTSYPQRAYERGIQVVICGHRVSPSDPIAGHKTTSYLPRLIGLRQAQQAQCIEALWFTTNNYLAEGSISNVFVVRDGVLKTPPLDTPCLPGIARDTVLKIARGEDLKQEQAPLSIDNLLDADEVFITNVILKVMPVVLVEKHDIGDGKVGAVTQRIADAYDNYVVEECGTK